MLYRNKKTKKIYRWLANGIDTTNDRDGLEVVVYCPNDNEHTVFVREAKEFDEKFEPLGGILNGHMRRYERTNKTA